MKIKICGNRSKENIAKLVELAPDYLGFIFYPKSKRFVGDHIEEEILEQIPVFIQKVGVFVDEPFDELLYKWKENRLDLLQLHGSELPGYCERLKVLGIPIIKVFGVDDQFDFKTLKPYESVCDYFLFDTLTDSKGGSGKKFNWDKLDQYVGSKPFFLSGGISVEDDHQLKSITHEQFFGVDINSRFETEPAIKDVELVKKFITSIKK